MTSCACFTSPALEDAERYDRLTGYFNAGALVLGGARHRGAGAQRRPHAAGRRDARCHRPRLRPSSAGTELREQVERYLAEAPAGASPIRTPPTALELLAWMVARGHLEVKVAVPCDTARRPIPEDGIFHEKAGIVTDRAGDTLAWNGSLNETAAGWRRNWESINVYTSWGPEPERVADEDDNFARIWADQTQARDRAGRARGGAPRPAALHARQRPARAPAESSRPIRAHRHLSRRTNHLPARIEAPAVDLRRRVWAFIDQAPLVGRGGRKCRRGDGGGRSLAAPSAGRSNASTRTGRHDC